MSTTLLMLAVALGAVATALAIRMFHRDDTESGLLAMVVMLVASVIALGYSAAEG